MQLPLLDNYKVKLVSVLVAMLFWFVVVTENEYDDIITVAIRPVNIPEDRIVVNDLPATARVKFKGNGKTLLGLRYFGDAAVELDLSHTDDQALIPLTPDMVSVSRASQELQALAIIEPDQVEVKLARLKQKRVKIIPQIEIEADAGFALIGGIRLLPDSLTIKGPVPHVRSITEIKTEKRHFERVRTAFRGHVPLVPFADSLRIQLPLHEVTFEADVQKLLEYEIQEVPVHVINVPANLEITALPSVATVTVVGGEKQLLELDLKPEDIFLYIDYDYSREHKNEDHKIFFKPIDGIEIRKIYPSTYILEIRRK
ncbi:MAG TPA: hypothetical protein ENJ29_13020 [Bacteroidetes bacterium]|nr:hypothetical protein [Bacteroidota bacterium]